MVSEDVYAFHTKLGTKLKVNFQIPTAVTAAYLSIENDDTTIVDGVSVRGLTSYTTDISASVTEGTYKIELMLISMGVPSGFDFDYARTYLDITHQTPVGPTELAIQNAFVMSPGDRQLCSPVFIPSETTLRYLTLKTDNAGVAGVESGYEGGIVIANQVGKAKITLIAENGVETYVAVHVLDLEGVEVMPTSMTLPSKVEMAIGETQKLEPKFTPSNTTIQVATNWKSSNTNVAEVDYDGNVTAKSVGTATISTTAFVDKEIAASCIITVKTDTNNTGDSDPSDPDDSTDPDSPNDNPADDPESPEQISPKTVKTLASVYVVKNKTVTLPASIQPTNAKDKTVTWKSSSPNVVAVNKTTGKIKGLKTGKATLTVTTNDGNKKAKCTVYVVAKATKVKSLVAQKPIGLTVGKTTQIKVKTTPAKATGIVPKFSSSKKTVVTIDKAGVITAKKLGTSVITIKAGGKTQKVTVTVGKVLPTKVTLNKKSISIKAKATYKLTAKLSPTKANPTTVTWTSNNKKVATVDKNGKVKAIKKGKATITATTWNGKTTKCTVIVR